jgi:hypothetical protein
VGDPDLNPSEDKKKKEISFEILRYQEKIFAVK